MNIKRVNEYIQWCKFFKKPDAEIAKDFKGLVEYNELMEEKGLC